MESAGSPITRRKGASPMKNKGVKPVCCEGRDREEGRREREKGGEVQAGRIEWRGEGIVEENKGEEGKGEGEETRQDMREGRRSKGNIFERRGGR
eukprot:768336-Hanusia_phi.AAC.3